MKTYFIVCKNLTNNTNPEAMKIKGRLVMKSICSVCGSKKFRFIS